MTDISGTIFDIQKFSINDGPGIRTTVFFKGCPLNCGWCSNPESQDSNPELFYFENLCSRCYRCVEVCPNRATTIESDGSLKIDRDLCKACGACAEVCLSDARVVSGREISTAEVVDIVKKDSLFYRNSGGGITVSGGEPTAQPKFLIDLLRRCQDLGFHTTLDTCGYVKWEVMEKILKYVDLVLFDLKHMDPLRHQELAGSDNEMILKNAESIGRMKKQMIIRLPLIPGVNDSEENIRASARFMSHIDAVRVDLVPYHRLGVNKYKRLGKEYLLASVKSLDEEAVARVRDILEAKGLEVSIA